MPTSAPGFSLGRGARTIRVLAGRPCGTDGAVILGYHDIRRDPSDPYDVTPDQLRRHLHQVRRAGHRFVSLHELVRALREGDPLDGLAAVTFDDALEGVLHHGAPILNDEAVPGTLFVVTDALGRTPRWWPGPRRVMTRAALEEVVASGLELGSHTSTHRDLVYLSPTEVEAELRRSAAWLSDLTGSPITLLAYPNGRWTPAVRDQVAASGYEGACTFTNGRVVPLTHPLALPRFTMGSHHSRTRLAAHLARAASTW